MLFLGVMLFVGPMCYMYPLAVSRTGYMDAVVMSMQHQVTSH